MTNADPTSDLQAKADSPPDPFKAPLPIALLYKKATGIDLSPVEKIDWDKYSKQSERVERNRSLLGIVDLGLVMEDGVTEPEMLVPDLLVKADHHLVYGPKESAKTWLMLHCAVRLIGDGTTVAWVDKEMGQRNLANRLITLGASPADVSAYFVYLEHPVMDISKDSQAVWKALLQHRQPELVIFDAQTELLADAGLNENSGTDVEKWAQPYITPARRIGAATVMIDHTGHSDTGRSVGSRQKGAAAKVELSISKDAPFGRDRVGAFTVTRTKNTVSAPIPEKQSFQIGGRDGEFVFESAAGVVDPKLNEKAERAMRIDDDIRKLLADDADGKGYSQNQVVGLVTGGKQAIADALRRLSQDPSEAVSVQKSGQTLRYSTATGSSA